MEDLSWAYHELENLYDNDVESESSSKNSSSGGGGGGGGGGYRNNEDDSHYDVDGNEEDYYTPSSRTARLCSNDRRMTTTTTAVATQKRKKGNGNKTKKTKMKTKHNFIISQNKSEKNSTITRVLKNCHVPNRSSSMQHLMMGIESPSLFSPRCFTMGIGRNSSSLDIVAAIDEERTKNTTDDVSVGKRIEVQWDMDDGSKEWYAGTVTSISNDKTEAVLLYDDGECCLMDIVDPTEWRTVTATEPIAAAATTTTPENTCNDTYAIVPKAREGISSLPPCNTIISGTVLPSSPIVKKKKKKTSANTTTTTKTKNVKDSEIRSSQSQSQLQLQLLIAEKRKRINHKSHPARRRPVPLPIK